MFQPLLRRLRLRQKALACASGGPAGGRPLAGGRGLGRCEAEQSKYYRFYLYSGKLTLAAMYLRRVRVNGRSLAAGAPPLTNDSPVVTPPVSAAQNFGVGLRRPCRRQTYCGMLSAMVRISPARPATPPTDSTAAYLREKHLKINLGHEY
jgi:hypothetical protein